MEKLLRACYSELKICGANAPLFEKRKNGIDNILDNAVLDREEYKILTDWLMGVSEEPEDLLIKLEENFCEYDEDFMLQYEEGQETENKEIKILCMILLYQYCDREEDNEFPVKILCGDGVGYRLKSHIMTEKFKNMVVKCRISSRQEKEFLPLNNMVTFSNIKKAINAADKENISYDMAPSEQKKILEQIEVCQQNIRNLKTNEEHYCVNMKTKSEETNLLWWIVNEWSESYQEMYRNMTVMEAALTAPMELYNLIEFELYPYTTEQMIRKVLSVTKEFSDKEYSLYDMVKNARKELTDSRILELSKEKISSKIQPILLALTIKKKTEKEEDWMVLFRTATGYEMTELKMSCVEFALQLCRELELLGYSKEE